MDNDQLMLNLFKQQQYNVTRMKLQKVFLIFSTASSTLGVIITSILFTDWWNILVFLGPILCVAVSVLLVWVKTLTIQKATLIAMLYNCIVFIPSLWLVTGIHGVAPMVSIIILVAIITLFAGKTLKWLLTGYMFINLALTVYSAVTEFPGAQDITSLVYMILGFIMAIVIVALYMLYKQKEFDELNDRFLRSSFKDELTQLYNRKLLDIIIEYVESMYKHNKIEYILVMFDVDNFKELNDTHGHIYGDIILRSVAQCIQEKARSSDFIVRYGGDEFLVIQPKASDVSIKGFIKRIDAEMERSCSLDIPISGSYGFAARSECNSPEEALKLADKRLYENKQAKKARS